MIGERCSIRKEIARKEKKMVIHISEEIAFGDSVHIERFCCQILQFMDLVQAKNLSITEIPGKDGGVWITLAS